MCENMMRESAIHCVKRVISGPYFPVFGLNTEIYEVDLRIQSEYGKIWTRNNFIFGHFSLSDTNAEYA